MYDIYFNLFILIYKINNLLPVGVICRCRNASRSSDVKYIYLRYIRTLTLKRFKYQRGAFQKAWDSFSENVFLIMLKKAYVQCQNMHIHLVGNTPLFVTLSTIW